MSLILEVERTPAFCTLEDLLPFLPSYYFLRTLEPEILPRHQPCAPHRFYLANVCRVALIPLLGHMMKSIQNKHSPSCSCSRSSCLKLQLKNPGRLQNIGKLEKDPLLGRHSHSCVFGEWHVGCISALTGPLVFGLHAFVGFGFHHIL